MEARKRFRASIKIHGLEIEKETAMKRLEKLAAKVTGRHVLILLGIQFLVQGAILFGTYPLITNGGAPPLDLQVFYEPSMVGFYLASIGEAGRSWYLINQATLDLIFPVAYGSANVALFLWLVKKCRLQDAFYKLGAVPLLIVFFDLIENACIISAIVKFPEIPKILESVTATASAGKQSAMTAAFIVAVILIGTAFARRKGE